MRALFWTLLVAVAGCAGAPRGASFDGRPQSSRVSAMQIRDVSELPTGYDDIGTVQAVCTYYEGTRPPDGAPLSDVDCGAARLTRALREQAAEVGGELLVARRCYSRVLRQNDESTVQTVRCAAGVARGDDAEAARRPLAAHSQALDEQEPAREGYRIAVRFAENPRAGRRAPRRVDHVRQVPTAPVSHQLLGEVLTECDEGCSRRGAERAVLIAAGRFGASDVAELSCSARGQGFVCHGKALAHEVDPERYPDAR